MEITEPSARHNHWRPLLAEYDFKSKCKIGSDNAYVHEISLLLIDNQKNPASRMISLILTCNPSLLKTTAQSIN